MKISELRTGSGNVEVEGEISEIGDTRSFNKYGRELKVANAILKDNSGAIKLSLWNDDVSRFKEGDKIKIVNGYVSEFQGEKQLTSGKFGRIEKVGGETNEKKVTENSIQQEVAMELRNEDSKSKKATVSKRDLKKKNEESLDEYSEDDKEEVSDEEPTEEEIY